jgi:hypothetical protein
MLLNTSTSLITDVIGKDNTSSAFVYGVYSLFDKVANGVLGYLLVAFYSKSAVPLRYIMALIPTISAAGCAILTGIGIKIYKDKLAKISAGSTLAKKGNTNAQ